MKTSCALVVLGLLLGGCKTAPATTTTPPPASLPPLRAPPEAVYCQSGVGAPLPLRTTETLSDDDIKAVFAQKEKDLHSCFKDRIRRGYVIGGYVGIRFVVSPQGFAQQLCLVEDATGDADFLDCMFGEIGTWQFPKKPAPTEVRKRFLFQLKDD